MSGIIRDRERNEYFMCFYVLFCSLVSTSRDTPVHMWDAFTGEMRCSYRAFDQMVSVIAGYSSKKRNEERSEIKNS